MLNLQFSSFIFIREWEWNSKHSDLELMCVTLLRVMGSVFFQWETDPHTDRSLLQTSLFLAAFLLIVAYSFKNQLTTQLVSGGRFQSTNDI